MFTHVITLGLHWFAVLLLAAAFFGFKFGYSKKGWDQARAQARIWKREQDRLPRAIRMDQHKASLVKKVFGK